MAMHILVTGGTGFIGAKLLPALEADGHRLTVLTRGQHSAPGRTYINSLSSLTDEDNVEAVINLAGASLGGRRWNARYKREIIDSRLHTTEDLVAWMAGLEQRPHTLLSASAIGYYGHHGDEALAEDGAVAPGFSSDLCARWESAASAAGAHGVRVCLLRLGVVIDAGGGALTEMARPFRMGAGSWQGSGQQWLSWIHRDDVVSAINFLLQRADLAGPFNLTAPQPVTNRQFSDALRDTLGSLVYMPMPAMAMRLLVGEMADELLLNGQRVVPQALQTAGFEFECEAVASALARSL